LTRSKLFTVSSDFLGGCPIIVATFSVYKIIKIKKKLKHLRQGRDGERTIGQYLEGLRETGCRVFHDIVGNGLNLDHVVISQHGVFVIETKTYSKPQKGEAKITVAGEQVLINGVPCKSNVITQAGTSITPPQVRA